MSGNRRGDKEAITRREQDLSNDLKKAVLNLNSKLRRNGKISAFEINSSRDQNTGQKLDFNDANLRNQQLATRKKHQDDSIKADPIFVGDTVSIKNKSNKHTANEIFLTVAKEGEKVKVQKILHPLKGPIKIMSKMYATNEKRLKMLHRPERVLDYGDQLNDTVITRKCTNFSTWNPIDDNFYKQYDTDDETEEFTIIKTKRRQNKPISLMNTSAEAESDNEVDLEWDDSPEQIQLQVESSNEFQPLLQPRQLFNDENDGILESLTPESSDDEVFIRNDNTIRSSNKKLSRRNAFRRKKRVQALSNSVPMSRSLRASTTGERRITRSSLNNESLSLPVSPSEVILHRRQELNMVLPLRAPVVPEAVNLNQVQQLNVALDSALRNPDRPVRSTRRMIDYAKFHETGEKS